MSYDLELHAREGNTLSWQEVADYFADRDHCTVGEEEVHYHNDHTGVYFHFSWYHGRDEEDPNATQRAYLHFNMNYFRPLTFGLEAERVLTPLAAELALVVSDPQADGMGDGEYSAEGFLRGWNAGNRFAVSAVRAMRDREGETPLTPGDTLPADRLRAVWEWNYGRDAFGEHLWEDEDLDVFVPHIMFVRHEGRVRTLCVWGDVLPTAMPVVDLVLVCRKHYAVAPLADEDDMETALATWEQFRAATAAYEPIRDRDEAPLDYVLLDHENSESAPEELVRFIQSLPPHTEQLQGIAADQVLHTELTQEAS